MKRLSTEPYLKQMQEAIVDLLGKTVTRHLPANNGFIIAALSLLDTDLISLELRVTDVREAAGPNDDEQYTASLSIYTNQNGGGALLYMHFNGEDFEEYENVLEGIFENVWVARDDGETPRLLSDILNSTEHVWSDIEVRCDLEDDESELYLSLGKGIEKTYYIVETAA